MRATVSSWEREVGVDITGALLENLLVVSDCFSVAEFFTVVDGDEEEKEVEEEEEEEDKIVEFDEGREV